jgi:hypothetical protein
MRTFLLHWRNHKFALEPCGWRMLDFCHDVVPLFLSLLLQPFWHGKEVLDSSGNDSSVDRGPNLIKHT